MDRIRMNYIPLVDFMLIKRIFSITLHFSLS